MLRWMLALMVCTMAGALPLLGQDSTVVVDPDAGLGAGALAYGLSEVLKWGIPLLGGLLFSAWNKVNSWLGNLADWLKPLIATALTTVLMLVGEFINATISTNMADWSAAFWEGLAAGLVSTLLVKIGIAQVKDPAKASGAKAPRIS